MAEGRQVFGRLFRTSRKVPTFHWITRPAAARFSLKNGSGMGRAKQPGMIQGIYQGAASMDVLERWQASIADNLASASVAGFKKEDTNFTGVETGRSKLADGDFGTTFLRVSPQATQQLNTAQGAVRSTGKDLDVAVQGSGFFQVQRPEGGTAYTRNGEFHLDGSGTLVNSAGMPVQGDGGSITVDATLGPITIDKSGQLSQGDSVVGKLALYAGDNLQRANGGLLMPKDGNQPKRLEQAEVLQGFVEESNVTPLQEMVNLIDVSRAYEISQKLITTLDQNTKSAIDTLGNP
jgi:flagellar basal-body rod protein FlgF